VPLVFLSLNPVVNYVNSSPVLIIALVVVLPIALFLVILRRMLRTGGVRSSVGPRPPEVAEPNGQKTEFGLESPKLDELAKSVAQLGAKVDRTEANLSKVLSSGIGDMMNELRGIGQKVEDAVLAIKAAQSDALSPFSIKEREEKGNGDDKSVRATVPGVERAALREALGNYDLASLLVSCAVLEVAKYDEKQIERLYELGLLTIEHMDMITRIRSFMDEYQPPLRAKDVAQIVVHTGDPRVLFDQGVRRVMRVLQEVEDSNARRSDK
jgi:hypothetical protein